MTTQPHTPEKCRACETETLCRPADGLWGVRCTVCFDEKFPGATTTEEHGTEAERLEKKRRQHAVACVNACAGIKPEAVPELVESRGKLEELRTAMKAHRDECAANAEEGDPYCCKPFLQDTVDAIDNALAKARPELCTEAVQELVKADLDPDKLDKLARWFDLKYPNHDDDVQRDLRLWASRIRAALAKAPPEPKGDDDGVHES